MTQPDATVQNGETGKAVAKQSGKASGNRFSTVYWESRVFRPTYTRDGETIAVSQFSARVAHGGRRHTVPLATNNLDEAARRAVKLYRILKQSGWDAALRLFRPDAEPIDKALTIGKYLTLVDDYTPMPLRTFSNYGYALRRIAADIAGAKLTKGENRFDPSGRWRKSVDEIPLSTITAVKAEDWRTKFVKEHRSDKVAEQRATRSANSYLRNARALFSKRILEAMRKHGVTLPAPLPFFGVSLDGNTGSTRYRSQVDVGEILAKARGELSELNAEAYAVVLLALGAGLRRSEIDSLQRQHLMRDKALIRVMTTAERRVKSDDSERDVHVDDGVFSELERVTRKGSTLFLIQADTPFPKSKAAQIYRCEATFSFVTEWLRKHGVDTEKPLHTLRKEFGSLVAASGDIFQAQRQLGHAQISTTEQYYADARKRATVPVGSLLAAQKAGAGAAK
jgi:integrase